MALLALGGLSSIAALCAMASPATARALPQAFSANWCGAHGSSFAQWAGTSPNIAICGPGPGYGGGWNYVDLPGPAGDYAGYVNATPGFQCVELAERYLAVAYGFSPVHANGSSVAANYHSAYPRTELIVNQSAGAVHHAPVRGDVVSFAFTPSFNYGDGHVAIVVASTIDRRTGDGTVTVAQENVSSADYRYTLQLANWKLFDPKEPGNAEFQFHYAEWLHVNTLASTTPGPSAFMTSTGGGRPAKAALATASAVRASYVLTSVRSSVTPHRTEPAPHDTARAHVAAKVSVERPLRVSLHRASSVRAITGAGLGIVLALASFALVVAGARHRRLIRARHFAKHPATLASHFRSIEARHQSLASA